MKMAPFHHSAELEGLLRYTTGSYNVPPAGYSAGCIKVAFQEHVMGITASTCVPQLTFPKTFKDYETFCIEFKSRSPTRKKIFHHPVTYEALIHVHLLVKVFGVVTSQSLNT